MKRLMALVLSVSMVLCTIPSFVFAAEGSDTPTETPKITLDEKNTEVSGIEESYTFTGKEIKISNLVVKYTGTEEEPKDVTLTEGTDYEVKYENNTKATTEAKVTITGKGNYAGVVDKPFIIEAVDPTTTGTLNITIPTQNLDQEAVKNVEITWNGIPLVEGADKDFTVEGTNDTLGTKTATIEFKGNYKGTTTRQYNVVSNDIGNAAFYWAELNKTYVYDTTAKEPAVRINLNNKTLVKDVDYTVSYKNNINAGKAEVIITGIGEYAGNKTETFTIEKAQLSDTEVTFIKDTYTATGSEITPVAGEDFKVFFHGTELKANEYQVKCKNNITTGTATMTLDVPESLKDGNFTGTKTVQFEIVDKAVSDLDVTLEKTSYDYTGSAIEPAVTVKDGDKELVKDTDYTVTYENNVNAGEGIVTVTGKGAAYKGSKSVAFKINGKQTGLITGRNTYTVYGANAKSFNLKARSEADATGFVYTANNPEIATVDPSGNVYIHDTGKATITVETVGTKEYNPLKKTIKVVVKPETPKVTLSSSTKGVIKVTFTKVDGATKYQVRYGRMGKYYYKYVTHKDNEFAKTYTTLKNRTSGKTYYIKVRAYKEMADGTRVYGDWTATKKLKSK